MTLENSSWSIYMNECCWTRQALNSETYHQSKAYLTRDGEVQSRLIADINFEYIGTSFSCGAIMLLICFW